MECTEDGCDSEASFELHIPWTENRVVCAPHARVEGEKDGIVADPLDGADDRLPEGATDS